MPKEDKPLEYERRILDTKGLAQRIDLSYLGRGNRFRDWRRRLTLLAPLAAAVAAAPFIAGLGGGEKVFSNGPVSRAHTLFAEKCSLCHAKSFSQVADVSCGKCHDGPIHQANAIGSPRCAECHVEHRDRFLLAEVGDRHCTGCHADLSAHGRNLRLEHTRITAFRPGRHPDFAAAGKLDRRPLRLNHAVHMPAQPKTIRSMKLPMTCSDCHVTDLKSPRGDLHPVVFEQHCRSCHKRELEFDVHQALGASAPPAPHTKDAPKIHEFVLESYQNLLASDPSAAKKPLGRDLTPEPSPAAWLARVVKESERYLFERKCTYCHEYETLGAEFPVVRKVGRIEGQYAEGKAEKQAWVEHAEFSHRAHRALECVACHRAARASSKTSDVLIPRMESCRPCHGDTGTPQDRCVQCHSYHDKSREREKDRRPLDQLAGGL